jgi:hypothetical protein
LPNISSCRPIFEQKFPHLLGDFDRLAEIFEAQGGEAITTQTIASVRRILTERQRFTLQLLIVELLKIDLNDSDSSKTCHN